MENVSERSTISQPPQSRLSTDLNHLNRDNWISTFVLPTAGWAFSSFEQIDMISLNQSETGGHAGLQVSE